MSDTICHTTCSVPAPEPTEAELARRAAMFKALGHPVRLRLVMKLKGGAERCVHELHAGAARSISTTSAHLGILRRSGVVTSRRRGQRIYYRLSTGVLRELISCLSSL